MKVLLVDDDPSMRRMIHRVLAASFQVDVCEVDDGLGALERLQEEAFDLVILDIQMKVIDGAETLQAIRRTSTFRSLPIVVISGTVDQVRAKQLIALNVSEIVAKPFTPSTLRARLAPLMERIATNEPLANVPARARLNLRPDSRLLLVGPKDRFQDFLLEHLVRVCDVTPFPTAPSALRDALSRTPDGVFITGDDPLLPASLFARKLHPQAHALPRVYLCEPAAAPFSDDSRWFDGRLNKATSSRGLFKELRPLLTNSGLALALLPPASPFIEDVWKSVAATVQTTLDTKVALQAATPVWSSPDQRTVEAVAEVHVDDVSWKLDLLVTHEYGLRYASTLSGGASLDILSEADVLESVKAFATHLASSLRDALLEYDITARVGTVATSATDGFGLFSTAPTTQWLAAEGNIFAAALRIAVL